MFTEISSEPRDPHGHAGRNQAHHVDTISDRVSDWWWGPISGVAVKSVLSHNSMFKKVSNITDWLPIYSLLLFTAYSIQSDIWEYFFLFRRTSQKDHPGCWQIMNRKLILEDGGLRHSFFLIRPKIIRSLIQRSLIWNSAFCSLYCRLLNWDTSSSARKFSSTRTW